MHYELDYLALKLKHLLLEHTGNRSAATELCILSLKDLKQTSLMLVTPIFIKGATPTCHHLLSSFKYYAHSHTDCLQIEHTTTCASCSSKSSLRVSESQSIASAEKATRNTKTKHQNIYCKGRKRTKGGKKKKKKRTRRQ